MAIMRNCRRIISALAVSTSLVLQELMCGLSRLTCRRQLINGCVRFIVHARDKLQQNETTLARGYTDCRPLNRIANQRLTSTGQNWACIFKFNGADIYE
jgi:hypothetical protein